MIVEEPIESEESESMLYSPQLNAPTVNILQPPGADVSSGGGERRTSHMPANASRRARRDSSYDSQGQSLTEQGSATIDEPNRCVIHEDTKFKDVWNSVMFCLLMYTATIVPVRIPFEDEASLGWLVIDIMTDTFFFIDIFVNFLSSYEDESGKLRL